MNDIYNLFFYIIDLILIGNRLESKRNRGVSWYNIFEKIQNRIALCISEVCSQNFYDEIFHFHVDI